MPKAQHTEPVIGKEDPQTKSRIRPVIEEVAPPESQSPPMASNSTSSEPPSSPLPPPQEHGKRVSFKVIFIVTILTALVVGFVLGGIYVYFTGVKSVEKSGEAPVPTVRATATPTPTPEVKEEELDLSKYEISVLNGSGKIGEAGRAQDLLEAEDFVVVSTGNAASFDFEMTEIKAKKSVPEGAVALISDTLKEAYEVDSDLETLESGNKYDVVVTIGSSSSQAQ
jgi:hypothetical protein